MKKILLMLAVILTATVVFAQKVDVSNIPSLVTNGLFTKYPDAKIIKWENAKKNYKAVFKHDNTRYMALINPSGKIIRTKIKINESELPKNAKNYTAQNYPDKKIVRVTKVTNAKDIPVYQVHTLENRLTFDKTGELIKELPKIEQPTNKL